MGGQIFPFLCGDDTYSGKNYDHRRAWVELLLFELEAVFAIDVAAFAERIKVDTQPK